MHCFGSSRHFHHPRHSQPQRVPCTSDILGEYESSTQHQQHTYLSPSLLLEQEQQPRRLADMSCNPINTSSHLLPSIIQDDSKLVSSTIHDISSRSGVKSSNLGRDDKVLVIDDIATMSVSVARPEKCENLNPSKQSISSTFRDQNCIEAINSDMYLDYGCSKFDKKNLHFNSVNEDCVEGIQNVSSENVEAGDPNNISETIVNTLTNSKDILIEQDELRISLRPNSTDELNLTHPSHELPQRVLVCPTDINFRSNFEPFSKFSGEPSVSPSFNSSKIHSNASSVSCMSSNITSENADNNVYGSRSNPCIGTTIRSTYPIQKGLENILRSESSFDSSNYPSIVSASTILQNSAKALMTSNSLDETVLTTTYCKAKSFSSQSTLEVTSLTSQSTCTIGSLPSTEPHNNYTLETELHDLSVTLPPSVPSNSSDNVLGSVSRTTEQSNKLRVSSSSESEDESWLLLNEAKKVRPSSYSQYNYKLHSTVQYIHIYIYIYMFIT